MLDKTKKLASMISIVLINACGGGGGSSSAPASTTPAFAYSSTLTGNLSSNAANPTFTKLVTFSTNLDYSSVTLANGKFGSASANCVVTQETARSSVSTNGDQGSNPTVPNAQIFVFCQQTTGAYAEVSQSLFGQNLFVNGGYPLVGDFNNDGIDDLVLINAFDSNYNSTFQLAVISRGENAGYTQTNLSISNLYNINLIATQSAVTDFNHDGCKDVMMTDQKVLIGDCHGGLVQQNITSSLNLGLTYGTGVCAGDFIGRGSDQYLYIDGHNTNSIVDYVSSTIYNLPAPYWDSVYGTGTTHNFICRVADINNDSKPDILIFERPLSTATNNTWTDQSYVQVLINNGAGVFTDQSTTYFNNYNTNTSGSYSPQIIDINGDGKLDFVLDGQSFNGQNTNGNQIWLNKSSNSNVFNGDLSALYNTIPNVNTSLMGTMYLVKSGNAWDYLVEYKTTDGYWNFGIFHTQFQFK
jgi:hypothetical protein